MSKPENGAEKMFFVLGKQCVQIFDWNEHYIKEESSLKNLIIFDVSEQKYYSWEEFVTIINNEQAWIDITPEENAKKNIKRLRYKCYLPTDLIPMKKALKTKKKIENKYVCTPASK